MEIWSAVVIRDETSLLSKTPFGLVTQDRQTDRHVYLESYTINNILTTTDFQITKNYEQVIN